MSNLNSDIKVTLASGLSQPTPAGVTIALPAHINPTVSTQNISIRTVNSSIADTSLPGHVVLNTGLVSNPNVSSSGLSTTPTPVVVIRSITGTTGGGAVSNVVTTSIPSGVKIATFPTSTTANATSLIPSSTALGATVCQPVRLTSVMPTTVPLIRSAIAISTARTAGNTVVPIKTGPLPTAAVTACASPVKLPPVKEPISQMAKTSLRPGTSSSSSSHGQQRHVIREMQVRVPNRPDKRFSVLRFHSADRLDLSSGLEVFMQRENNLRQFRNANSISDTPERVGAGSEFGRDAKEEARLRKFGVVRESYRPDDQPWLMTVGKGKSGRRRFRGVREGCVSDNVQYFVFCQCKDGNFDAYPVHSWYKMKPEINYRFLRDEEAEMEYTRMHKTMNLFNVMIKRKLTDGDEGGEVTLDRDIDKELKYLSVATENKLTDGDSALSTGRASKQRGSARKGLSAGTGSRKLKLTDLEELDVTKSDGDEDDDDEDGDDDDQTVGAPGEAKESGDLAGRAEETGGDAGGEASRGRLGKNKRLQMQKVRKKMQAAARVSRMRRCVKKRQQRKKKFHNDSSSDEDDPLDEAQDDSELDDHEGDEVDYMTNSSSDEEKLSEEERHKIYEETGVDEEVGLKTLLTDLSSEEEEDTVNKADEDVDVKPDVDSLVTDMSEESSHATLLDRVKKEEQHDSRRGAQGEAASGGPDAGHHSSTRRHHRKHRRKRKQKKALADDDRLSSSSSSLSSPGGAGGNSSSSSSSIDGAGDSSVYSSSSSTSSSSSPSSSDSEPDEIGKAKLGRATDRKHNLLQKLSDSIHSSTAGGVGVDAGLEAAGRLGVGGIKRQPPEASDAKNELSPSCSQPAAKMGRMASPESATATSSLPTPSPSTSSTGADSELKNTVRKYLMRKPITVTELLKKIRLRKLVGKNENPQTALANVLRQLRPIKQIINGQHALSLKH